jgi:GWxTD domain-containing protein
MKKSDRSLILALCLASFCLSLAASAQTKKSVKDLSPFYRKWLQEDVVYIITPKEKEVFLQLDNDRQRDMFIEAFWKQRDPNPSTPENEFKTEHYRRIAYANQHFGKSSPGPGWRSDQGRIYIILGEPNSTDRLDNRTELYPLEIWFYSGKLEYGLPNAFSVVFFKKDGIGEYELYSPIKYGPQYLMPNYNGDMTDYGAAYSQLFNIDPGIANLSLSLIEGEGLISAAPSIASEALLNQKIPNAPLYKVKDSYAEKLLAYKDIINVEYTANYIDSYGLARVLRSPEGLYYVHYLIEPSRLTFEQYGERYLSNLEINGSVTDASGMPVYQFERKSPIELNEDQMAAIRPKLFSYQDMLPLIAGRYKLNLLFKNTVSKEFSSFETDVTVPDAAEFRMSPLLLASRADLGSKYVGQNKPFLLARAQLLPTPRNDFAASDTLYVFVQLQGLSDDLRREGSIVFTILQDDVKVQATTRRLAELADPLNILESIPLASLKPANYEISASVCDASGAVLLTDQAPFFVSFMQTLPRPWVLSLPKPSAEDAETLNILGTEYLNVKDEARARDYLENAFRRNPQSPEYALDFCRLLYKTKDYRRVKEIALPFVRDLQRTEFLEILGQSSQALGELSEAIAFYKDYLAKLGTNLNVLNRIGDCYHQLGDIPEALVAYEKSLEINPNQDRIKALVKQLKESK